MLIDFPSWKSAIKVGESASLTRTLTKGDIELFAVMSGDINPAHMDEELQLLYLADAQAAGVILGARVPIVLTSPVDNILTCQASCAVAMLLAHYYRTTPP